MTKTDYPVYIISYKRPDRVKTLEILRAYEPVYIVVSDDDPTLEQYHARYSERLIVYRRGDYPMMMMDNLPDRVSSAPPRNAIIEIAKRAGYRAICMMDDDYRYVHVMPNLPINRVLFTATPKQIAWLIRRSFELLLETPELDVFAWAQNGDMPAPEMMPVYKLLYNRKAMNVFFARPERFPKFIGRLNEDANSYVYYGNRGVLYLSTSMIHIKQEMTQTNPGGMTEVYKRYNTYTKSFYTVMLHPSGVSVDIGRLGRPHHLINGKYTCPHIITGEYRKG